MYIQVHTYNTCTYTYILHLYVIYKSSVNDENKNLLLINCSHEAKQTWPISLEPNGESVHSIRNLAGHVWVVHTAHFWYIWNFWYFLEYFKQLKIKLRKILNVIVSFPLFPNEEIPPKAILCLWYWKYILIVIVKTEMKMRMRKW